MCVVVVVLLVAVVVVVVVSVPVVVVVVVGVVVVVVVVFLQVQTFGMELYNIGVGLRKKKNSRGAIDWLKLSMECLDCIGGESLKLVFLPFTFPNINILILLHFQILSLRVFTLPDINILYYYTPKY